MGDARETEKAPDAFRTISEVADDLDLPQHVLRFWETRFTQIRPVKRGGGRRFYRPEDVDLLRGIRHLLYGDGYTIKGVQKILKDHGVRHVQDLGVEREAAEMRTSGRPRGVAAPQDGVTFGGLLGLLPRRRGRAHDEEEEALPPMPELPLPFPDMEADRDLERDAPVPAMDLRRQQGRSARPGPPPRPPRMDPSFAPELPPEPRRRLDQPPPAPPTRRPTRGPAAQLDPPAPSPELEDPLLPFFDPIPPLAAPASEPIEARIRRLKEQDAGTGHGTMGHGTMGRETMGHDDREMRGPRREAPESHGSERAGMAPRRDRAPEPRAARDEFLDPMPPRREPRREPPPGDDPRAPRAAPQRRAGQEDAVRRQDAPPSAWLPPHEQRALEQQSREPRLQESRPQESRSQDVRPRQPPLAPEPLFTHEHEEAAPRGAGYRQPRPPVHPGRPFSAPEEVGFEGDDERRRPPPGPRMPAHPDAHHSAFPEPHPHHGPARPIPRTPVAPRPEAPEHDFRMRPAPDADLDSPDMDVPLEPLQWRSRASSYGAATVHGPAAPRAAESRPAPWSHPPSAPAWQGYDPFDAMESEEGGAFGPEATRPPEPLRHGPPEQYLPPHLRSEPRLSGQPPGAAPILSKADIHRLQATLYELSECRRVLEQALAPRGASPEKA